MGIKVALLSKPVPEMESLVASLKREPALELRAFLSPEQIEKDLRGFRHDALVVRLDEFTQKHLSFVDRLRAHFPVGPLSIVSRLVSDQARFLIRQKARILLFNQNYEMHDIAPALVKALDGAHVAARAHPRAERHGAVQVIGPDGATYSGNFLDFGKMGAKVKLFATRVAERDQVQLVYESSSGRGLNRIVAQVVWIQTGTGPLAQFFGSQTMGLQFIAYL